MASALIAVLTLVLVLFLPESVITLSAPLGLAMVFLLPGYLLTFALFNGRYDLNLRGEVVLTLVFAIVQAAIIGLVLSFTPRGLQAASLATILALLALFLTAIAYFRWSALPRRRKAVGLGSRRGIRPTRLLSTATGFRIHRNSAFLFFGLAAVLILAGLAFTIGSHQNPPGEKGFTEFQVSWPEGAERPGAGSESTAAVSIVNREHGLVNYTLQLVLNNTTLFSKKIHLGNNQSWKGPVSFIAGQAGMQRLDFLLFKDGNFGSPYLEDHLWINASETSENASKESNDSFRINSSRMAVSRNEATAAKQGNKVVVQGVSKNLPDRSSTFGGQSRGGGGGSSQEPEEDVHASGVPVGAEVQKAQTPSSEGNIGSSGIVSEKAVQTENPAVPQDEKPETLISPPPSATAAAESVTAAKALDEAGNGTNITDEIPVENNLSKETGANLPGDNLSSNSPPVLTNLHVSSPGPQVRGVTLVWTANATDPDGDEIVYRFLLNDNAVTDWSTSSSWTWNTTSSASGDYRMRVLARDGHHAPREGFDSFKDAAFTLLPLNRIPVLEDLRPDPASPQAPGVGITWTAQATDPDADPVLYKFFLNDRPVTVWSKFNAWKWETSGLQAGEYRIKVQARDGHHAPEVTSDAFKQATFTLSSSNRIPALQDLRPDKSSPQLVGEAITWTANATDPDGDEVLYKFLLNDKAMTDWLVSGSWTWNTSVLVPGDYRIRVLAKNNKHASADGDTSREATFTLSPLNRAPALQDLKPDPPSPQIAGTNISWTANATDFDRDRIVYRFLKNDRAVTGWTPSSSWTWNTSSASPGNYTIGVQARDEKHSGPENFDSALAAEFALLEPNRPPTLLSLSPDRPGPQLQGITVFWKVNATDSDGDKVLYRFFVNDRAASKWSESGSWAWATKGLPAGDYRIRVLARDGHHAPEESGDASLERTFTITSPNQRPVLQELRSDRASPQPLGGMIAFTARATDPDGDRVVYRFLLNDRAMTDWIVSDSWTWNASSAAPGDYKIAVQVRDGHHAPEESSDASREMTFTLSPPNQGPVVKDLMPGKPGPQPAGTAITWTARAADPEGDEMVYRFLLNGKAVTGWSNSSSWTWNTSALAPGDYIIGVGVRDERHSGPEGNDNTLNSKYTLSAPNQPPMVNGLDPDRPSPQTQGTSILWKAAATDPDGDKILYRFLVNGQAVTGWSESDSWTWATRVLPAISYRIGVEVRDGHHAPEGSFDGSKETTFTLSSKIDQEIDRLQARRSGTTGGQGQKAKVTQTARGNSTSPVVLGMGGSDPGTNEKVTPRNLG